MDKWFDRYLTAHREFIEALKNAPRPISTTQSVPEQSDQQPPFIDDGWASTTFLKGFERIVNDWPGYVCLVTQEGEEDGKNFSRSCAVRVDNISEVIRVLEVLLKR